MADLYDWNDGKGKVHKVSWAQHVANMKGAGTPLKPPPGSYDIGLDAQEAAAQRQLNYLGQDTTLGKTRALSDLEIGITGAGVTKDRSLSDLLTSGTRGTEDYGTSVANLERNYENLATNQAGQQRKTGTQAGGAVLQASRKRAANQALERKPIDLAYDRFRADNATAQDRVGQDFDWTKKGLVSSYGRGVDDLDTALERAGVENVYFGGDVAAARQAQASQLGVPFQTAQGTATPTPTKATTLTAAPGLGTTTRKRRRGKTYVTYGASAGGP